MSSDFVLIFCGLVCALLMPGTCWVVTVTRSDCVVSVFCFLLAVILAETCGPASA